jgi:hypothetical protein
MNAFAMMMLSCLATLSMMLPVAAQTVTGTPVPVILNGTNQVPPNTSTAKGVATLYQNSSQLCYNMTLNGLMGVTASHVHKGGVTENGPIILTLFSSANKTASELMSTAQNGCINANKTILATIGKNATGYYVNVHTAKYPDGEIRGQISKLFVNETTGSEDTSRSSSNEAASSTDSGTDSGSSTSTSTRRTQAKASATLKRLRGGQ